MAKKKVGGNSEIMRAPNHKKFYVTNVFGGLTDQDFRFEIMNEKIMDDKSNKWRYISDASIILTPVGAKRLFIALKESLDVYENEFGKIEPNPKDKKILDVRKK